MCSVSIFNYRKCASCTHVSGLLHALEAMTKRLLWSKASTSTEERGDDEVLPVTSYACQWNVPKKRKESSLPFSEAKFAKHVYGKSKKKPLKDIESFDPRPLEYKGTAEAHLLTLLDKLRGSGLSISLSLDKKTRFWKDDVKEGSHSPTLPTKNELQQSVSEFKKSLKLSADLIRDTEQHTRDQSTSDLWRSVRRHRLTASYFGYVKQRKPSTSPHSLVLRILNTSFFYSPATEWGKANEHTAILHYEEKQRADGHRDLYTSPSGFVVCEEYPFLGASPDAVVYDPSDKANPFGLAEVKCPYSCRFITPEEACSRSSFFCTFDQTTSKVKLARSHPYYCQVQGQMAITKRQWCDFIVFTTKGTSIERIHFDPHFWKDLLHCLIEFYDNCLGPEIVSPIHVLGLKVRDLRLM